MRLSIWQQFSSNHSASFTVVGEFESDEEARQAANDLRRLMTALVAYYSDQEHLDAFMDMDGPTIPITSVERAFAAEFGLDEKEWSLWGSAGVDWILTPDDIDAALQVYDKYVYVSNYFVGGPETWLGHEPFGVLLKRMNGRVFIEDYDQNFVRVDFMCAAPDEDAANALFGKLGGYLKVRRKARPYSLIDMIFPLINTIRMQRRKTSVEGFPSIQEGSVERDGLRLALRDIEFGFDVFLEQGVRQVVAALREHGCTDIEYRFVEVVNS